MENIKSNKIMVILALMILATVVFTIRSSGDCGDVCSGVCPVDTESSDVFIEEGFSGEVFNTSAGINILKSERYFVNDAR